LRTRGRYIPPFATVKKHKALLTLAKDAEGKTRLVTTNFDRIFERIIADEQLPLRTYTSPEVPIANESWDGLVYLHGLLDEKFNFEKIPNLVVSSGDFGQAYLIDQWASRFLGQLFATYSVCFVGYSLQDPIVQYMTDALAASRLRGNNPPEMYAFCGYSRNQRNQIISSWESKGVTPIPYSNREEHKLLDETLHLWSTSYAKGVQAKIDMIDELVGKRPGKNPEKDVHLSKLIWALSDPSGKPAEHFAAMNPCFSLDWLFAFLKKKYKPHEAPFPCGSKLNQAANEYTILQRPYPETVPQPAMSIVKNEINWLENDRIMDSMAGWLARHVNNPDLIVWISQSGGQLHPRFQDKIIKKLYEIEKNEQGEKDNYNKQRNKADERPDQRMLQLWALVLAGKCEPVSIAHSLVFVRPNEASHPIDEIQKRLFLQSLSPRISFRKVELYKPNRRRKPRRVSIDTVDSGVYISDQVLSYLESLQKLQVWEQTSSEMILDFTNLLNEALALHVALGNICDDYDRTSNAFDSLEPKRDRISSKTWMTLVALARDSWLALEKRNPPYASAVLEMWWAQPFILFKRLVLFALSQTNEVNIDQVIRMLSENAGKWLWDRSTRKEVFALLESLACSKTEDEIHRVEHLIMEGMPLEFLELWDKQDKEKERDRSLWVFLSVLRQDNPDVLTKKGERRYQDIKEKWEFPPMSAMRDRRPLASASYILYNSVSLPREEEALYRWIKPNQGKRDRYADNWFELCNDQIKTVSAVLIRLLEEGFDSISWWCDAFDAWVSGSNILESWELLSLFLGKFSKEFFVQCSDDLGKWLVAVAKEITHFDDLLFCWISNTLRLASPFDFSSKSLVSTLINTSIGYCVEALCIMWFRKTPQSDESLPLKIKNEFEIFLARHDSVSLVGSVVLASHLSDLFRLDTVWVRKNLLLLFDWKADLSDAQAVWQGYLSKHKKMNKVLLDDLKNYLLQTASYRDKLSEQSERFIQVIANACIRYPAVITYSEMAQILKEFEPKELGVIVELIKNGSSAKAVVKPDFSEKK